MPFKKGQSGNPGGKPKGAKNKNGQHLREMITTFLDGNFKATIKRDLKKLAPKDRLKFYTDLLPYAVSRLSSVDMGVTLEKLTEDQLDELFERVENAANEK